MEIIEGVIKHSVYFLRHEERYRVGDAECSLTPRGILKASTDTIKKIKKATKGRDPINSIYSSPFLRTLQTIFPFAKSKKLKIKVEDSLYEHLAYRILHYFCQDKKEKAYDHKIQTTVDRKEINLYQKEMLLIIDIIVVAWKELFVEAFGPQADQYLELNGEKGFGSTVQEILELVRRFGAMVDDGITITDGKDRFLIELRKEIDQLVTISDMMFKKNDRYGSIDQLIIDIESGNVSDFEASQKKFFLMMHQIANLKGPDIMENIINRMEHMFTETDIDQLIDRSYDSLIDIDKFYDQKVKQGVMVETSHDVMDRADLLIDKIKTDPEYQNAIFVSHQGVIEPILYKLMNIDPKVTIDQYEDYLNLRSGELIRVDFTDDGPVLCAIELDKIDKV